MNAVWVGLRADARRRWRAWLGVVLIVGLFGGIVTATAAGARRTDSAYSRFVVANHGAEYLVDDYIPNTDAAVLPPAAVAALPSIAEADSFRVFGPVNDVGYNLVASPDGRAYGTGLSRLKVLRGRLPDPARTGEAVADFTMPGARIGERVRVPLVASVRGDTHTPDLSGAPVWATFTVVGIVAAPAQFPPFPANSYYNGPNYYLTPAFYRTHERSVAAFEFSLVRLRPGAAAAAERQVEALGHGHQVATHEFNGQDRDVNRSTHLVAVALWLLAGLARRSAVAEASARAGFPVTLTAGVRMALERGRGRTSVPVRTTIGGAIVGLGAMVASLVFGASLGHLLGSPPLYGVTWDTEIWNNNGPTAIQAARPVVRADPDVATAAFIQTGIDFRLGGHVISGFAYDPVKGSLRRVHADRAGACPG